MALLVKVSSSPTERRVAVSLNRFCDGLLGDTEVQMARVANCVEALRLVIQVLQQSDRGRDGAVARIILSVAQGELSVGDGKQKLSAALLHG